MRFLINCLACFAIAIPVALGGNGEIPADDVADSPTCRASLDGEALTTAIEFIDGSRVEGPWRVVANLATEIANGESGHMVTAVLDRIVEVNATSGDRVESAFPTPIETTFEGRDDAEVVQRAAEIWCVVVMKAQGKLHDSPNGGTAPLRVAQDAPARSVDGATAG